MKTPNYWQQFTCTGRIEDYLSYAAKEAQDVRGRADAGRTAGADPYAGIHMCDRDDTEADACRGI